MVIDSFELYELKNSIKYLEYHWALYIDTFPNHAQNYKYKLIIEDFVDENRYDRIKTKKIALTNNYFMSKKQYNMIKKYAKINTQLQRSLKRNKPLKFKKKRTDD